MPSQASGRHAARFPVRGGGSISHCSKDDTTKAANVLAYNVNRMVALIGHVWCGLAPMHKQRCCHFAVTEARGQCRMDSERAFGRHAGRVQICEYSRG